MKRYPLKYKRKNVGAWFERHPVYQAFIDIKCGIFIYKYPLCCILQYVIETLKCEPSAYKRQHEYNYIFNGRYIPCNQCLKGKENETSKIL